jgi:peptidoglycan/xylan/chitin deacetylase (PgdA/CDA1 family)
MKSQYRNDVSPSAFLFFFASFHFFLCTATKKKRNEEETQNKPETTVKSMFLLYVSMLSIPIPATAQSPTIENYTPLTPPRCRGETALLRTFGRGGVPMELVVDTRTLRTRVQAAPKAPTRPCGDSRYLRLLRKASAAPWPLQNDGITRGRRGLYLTTDLCPSSKPGYEDRLYRALIGRLPHPVPVTLFLTERWIEKHPAAFRELRDWDRNGSLAITWGNHTAWHHYHPGRPLRENFVLSPEEHLREDVLELEKGLLRRGVTPSVFFRFPGLVSDRRAVETLRSLGLVILGSDAWIAKGEHPREGSVILLHGNGNEPRGVDRFLKMLEEGKIEGLDPIEKLQP